MFLLKTNLGWAVLVLLLIHGATRGINGTQWYTFIQTWNSSNVGGRY